jgi:hypothetical protein
MVTDTLNNLGFKNIASFRMVRRHGIISASLRIQAEI